MTGERPPLGSTAASTIPELDPEELSQHPRRRTILRMTLTVVIVVLALLAIGAVRTLAARRDQAQTLESFAQTQTKVRVSYTHARPGTGGQALVLPGTLQGYVESPIYARATGYLLRWHKDIGASVRKGELLAELDTPEIDQQLAQAIATRQQILATMELARSSMTRWEALRKKDAVSQQELDERSSAYRQAVANLASNDANVRRLQKLEAFKRITAPFSGVITRRNVDIGDLIDAGSGGSSARALFTLAQIDPLKINLFVPQSVAQRIEIGQEVQVRQSELAGQTFKGRIARRSGAIDTGTRTMQAVVEIPNPDGRLMPGAYVEVQLPFGAPAALVVPANVLLIRSQGTQIAVLGSDQRVSLRTVTLGRNFGRSFEVLSGVSIEDRLIVNPPDSLAEGDQVDGVEAVLSTPAPRPGAAGAPTGSAAAAAAPATAAAGSTPAPVAVPAAGTVR